jgi:predicted acylesterase/phospholipase RssA/CRP-like cAMP-binding protein
MSMQIEGAREAAPRPRADLRAILERSPVFAALRSEVLGELVEALELVEVPGGSCLVRAGQSLDSMLGVVVGSVRVVRAGDGLGSTIREFRQGDIFGVMGLLSDRTFPFALFTIRDSTLLRLSRPAFIALARAHPELLVTMSRLMAERAFSMLDAFGDTPRESTAKSGSFALLPLSTTWSVRGVKELLVEVALGEGHTTHVTAERVDRGLGPGVANRDEDPRIATWLGNLEQDGGVVLYEADPELPRWTARCKRQSDRLLMIAEGDPTPELLSRALAEAQPKGLARPVDLVLVHPPGLSIPSGTRAWSVLPELRAVHHVRSGNRGDIQRVVRRLGGRGVGLVLSGGGARGIAHVGVIAALVETGIPIDFVSGTSMGAIFAASLALGFDVPRMREELGELFGKPFALYDLTVPISSLLAGKKLERVLHDQLGEADIEDLWLPFFCVSTDLARAELVIHDRGSLWKSVRASASIPGIFPPLPFQGRTLVDGGLVDNLPLDLMVERCAGPIIAVDVFPYGDPGFERPSGKVAAWLRGVRTRVRGEPASPPLFDILVRSTLVGSKYRQDIAMTKADNVIYLEPPVATFGALEWRAHRALFEAGRRYARDELARRGIAARLRAAARA